MSEHETVDRASDVVTSIIYVSIFLAVMLLAIVFIIGGISTANTSLHGTTVTSATEVNETGGYLNRTGYTLAKATTYGFASPAIITIINATNNETISSGNYTLVGNILYNSTARNWPTIKTTYSYNYDTNTTAVDIGLTSIQTNIISMVTNFFALMPTVGTIFAVVILIGGIVILIIYIRRMKDAGSESRGDVFSG